MTDSSPVEANLVDSILVLNAGSASLKFSVFPSQTRPERRDLVCAGECEGIEHRAHLPAKDRTGAILADEDLSAGMTHEDAMDAVFCWLARTFSHFRWMAAGHRVVHGGARFTAPVRLIPKSRRPCTG